MTSTLNLIMQSASRYPLLTAEQELIYGRQVQRWIELRELDPLSLDTKQRRQIKAGERAYNKMFVSNIRLVISCANKFKSFPHTLGFEDLIQEGCVGLARAIEKFDPERGYKLSTYAYWWIRQAINRSLSIQDRIIRLPIDANDVLRKINQFIFEQKVKTGRTPSIKECCSHCGIKEDRFKSILLHANGVRSLDEPARQNDSDASALVDLIASPYSSPSEYVEVEGRLEEIEDHLKKLTKKQFHVINSHYGLNGQATSSLREIADEWKAEGKVNAREVVRQLHFRAINSIRRQVTAAA